MSLRPDARALLAFAGLGWRQAREQRIGLAGQCTLYVIVLAIFWKLWNATPLRELGAAAPSAAELVWYLVVTEWIVFACGARYREVEADILSGAIESGLPRPLPYALVTIARWIGFTAFQTVVLIAVGSACGWWLTGTLPVALPVLPWLALSLVLAILLTLLCHLQLGYVAIWLRSSAPAFWVWQKLLFVLGGLLIPLPLYPGLLEVAAKASPFASMLYAPASLILDSSVGHAGRVLGAQLFWIAVLAWCAWAVDRRAIRHLVRVGA